MKPLTYLIVVSTSVWLAGCVGKGREAVPVPNAYNFVGNWILYDKQLITSDTWIPLPGSSTPQTISLTKPDQVTTALQNDTTLAGMNYFQWVAGEGGLGVVGPFLLFKKKATDQSGRSFYYWLSANSDTLKLLEFGQPGTRYVYGLKRQN